MTEIIEKATLAVQDVLPGVQIVQPLDREDYLVTFYFDEFYLTKAFKPEIVKQPRLLAKLAVQIMDEFFQQRLKTLDIGPLEVSRTTENA